MLAAQKSPKMITLTNKELEQLPDGTEVLIRWSGENELWSYKVYGRVAYAFGIPVGEVDCRSDVVTIAI